MGNSSWLENVRNGVSAVAFAVALAGAVACSSGESAVSGSCPPGSYTQSCRDIQCTTSTVSASCTDTSGNSHSTQLELPCGAVSNCDGQLACGTTCGAASCPPGSYAQSCVNVLCTSNSLSASCTDTSGNRHQSQLPLPCSAPGAVSNCNGLLTCGTSC